MVVQRNNETSYEHICLGGTFDHLHAGHKRILDYAVHMGKKVSIGITSEKLFKSKKLSNAIESFHIRKEAVLDYLTTQGTSEHVSFFQLDDIYGIAGDDETLDGIIVTRETRPNAIKINKRRKMNGLKPLEILTVPFFKGSDNKIVRSERIRRGVISRIGDPYLSLFTPKKQLNLPPRLRELLRKPLGIIVEGNIRFASLTAEKACKVIEHKKPTQIILVGDIVSETLLQAGLKPTLCIIDNKTRRKQLASVTDTHHEIALNPPGTIRQEAVLKLHKLIKQGKSMQRLRIKGEEDLLALPAILLAPLGSLIVYGQFDMGIIITPVTEEKKEQIVGIIRQFE